jgi:hypothetical protein
MVTLFRRPNWKIAIYGSEHGAPHFHIEGAGFRWSIGISELEPIVGSAPASAMRDALEWARLNQTLLMQKWKELNG